MLEKLEIIMSLFTGIILLIVGGLVYKTPLLELSIKLLATMVVFYIIGLIIKRYLRKTVFSDSKPDGDTPENQENNEADKEGNKENEGKHGTETQQPDEEI